MFRESLIVTEPQSIDPNFAVPHSSMELCPSFTLAYCFGFRAHKCTLFVQSHRSHQPFFCSRQHCFLTHKL